MIARNVTTLRNADQVGLCCVAGCLEYVRTNHGRNMLLFATFNAPAMPLRVPA